MISSEQASVQYTLSGSGQTLAVPFAFLLSTDLTVVKTVAGADTLLVLNTDYTVSGGGSTPATGNVIMVAGTAGDVITIYRSIPETQTTSLGTLTTFPAKTIETTYDRLVMQVQRLQLAASRALRVPNTNGVVSEMTLAARASKVVGFDSSGNLTYYAFVGGVIAPQSVGGTANQVLVNGATTPVTGAVTLSLPQSIGTASTVQFGKLSINGSAIGNSDITVNRSVPGTTAQASVVVTGSLTAAYDLHPNAFRDTTTFTPTIAADGYCSYDAQTTMGGTVALNHYRGYQVRHGYTGTNTLGEMSGFMTANMGLAGTGTITFLRGFYVSNASISGGGTVGQFDGIYMDQLTNATGNVNAIYIAGNNRVFMAGGQIITSAALTPPAGATTCRGGFTFDQSTQTGLAVMNSNASATGVFVNFCNSGGTVQGSISQTNSTTVAYNTSSDSRLKENIRDITDSGHIFDSVQPRVFDWRWGKDTNTGKNIHGFIAQELAQVYPEAVTVGTDETDQNGNLMHPWGVDFSKLIPVMFSEVKDLRRRLAAAGIAA